MEKVEEVDVEGPLELGFLAATAAPWVLFGAALVSATDTGHPMLKFSGHVSNPAAAYAKTHVLGREPIIGTQPDSIDWNGSTHISGQGFSARAWVDVYLSKEFSGAGVKVDYVTTGSVGSFGYDWSPANHADYWGTVAFIYCVDEKSGVRSNTVGIVVGAGPSP